jgi:hypothetical protein
VPRLKLHSAFGRFWRLPIASRVLWALAALIALNIAVRAVAVAS